MTDRNKIISELFKSKEFNDCVVKLVDEPLREDLRGEVVLILLELPESELIEMHQLGRLRFYTARIILNQVHSVTSPFYKNYRMRLPVMIAEDICCPNAMAERIDRETKEAMIPEEVEKLDFYEREILTLYGTLGSYRKIQEATQIPWESTYATAQKAIKKIRKAINIKA